MCQFFLTILCVLQLVLECIDVVGACVNSECIVFNGIDLCVQSLDRVLPRTNVCVMTSDLCIVSRDLSVDISDLIQSSLDVFHLLLDLGHSTFDLARLIRTIANPFFFEVMIDTLTTCRTVIMVVKERDLFLKLTNLGLEIGLHLTQLLLTLGYLVIILDLFAER